MAYSYSCEFWDTKHVSFDVVQKRHNVPVCEKDDDVRTPCLCNALARVALQPPQRTTQGAATASTDKKAFNTHEFADGLERFCIGSLDPLVDVMCIAREDVRDEIVPNAFDDVELAFPVHVQSIGIREDAAFLHIDGRLVQMNIT